MNHHILSLDVKNNGNTKLLSIVDTSVYSTLLKVDCEVLTIIPPGFECGAVLRVEKGFRSDFTACDLGIQKVDCDSQSLVIPDGLYKISYSVSPNDKVYVDYYHLRIENALALYYNCSKQLSICGDQPSKESKILVKELTQLKTYLEAAQYKVQEDLNLEGGWKMYTYALDQLQKTCNKKSNCDC